MSGLFLCFTILALTTATSSNYSVVDSVVQDTAMLMQQQEQEGRRRSVIDDLKHAEHFLLRSQTKALHLEEALASLQSQLATVKKALAEEQSKNNDHKCDEPQTRSTASSQIDSSQHLEYITLSDRPRIYYYPTVLTAEECDEIIATGSANLAPSSVDSGRDVKVRSSMVSWIDPEIELNTPSIRHAKSIAFNITKIPWDRGEAMQIQQYKAAVGAKKQFYEPHFDAMGGAHSRVATWIFYLSDVEEGGETVFPTVSEAGSGARPIFSHHDAEKVRAKGAAEFAAICAGKKKALMIKPKKGSAVLFYTLTPDGNLDPNSLHGACPVIKGTKYIAQQWLKLAMTAPKMDNRMVAYMRAPVGYGQAQHCTSDKVDQVGESRAFTLSFHVKRESCASTGIIGITVAKKGGGERVPFQIRLREKCELATVTPARPGNSENQKTGHVRLKQKVVANQWTHIAFILENSDFDVTPDAPKWTYKNWLLINGKNPISFDGTVSNRDLDWSTASLCVRNSGGIDIRGLYLFSRQLDITDLEFVIMASRQDDVEGTTDGLPPFKERVINDY